MAVWALWWVGGWVGEFLFLLCMGDRKVEEEQAVRMSYCELGVEWVGGGWTRFSFIFLAHRQ